jgi:hypothetical protein
MTSYHHKPIKRFSLEGMIHDDSAIWRLRSEYLKLLTTEMKIQGYVQRLDIEPDFTIVYNIETQSFNFELSIYGIYVGKKQVKWIAGIDGTKAIPIVQSKLEESYQDQV